jgi:hypothetical protein
VTVIRTARSVQLSAVSSARPPVGADPAGQENAVPTGNRTVATVSQLLSEARALCDQAQELSLGDAEQIALLRKYGEVPSPGSGSPFGIRQGAKSAAGSGAPISR